MAVGKAGNIAKGKKRKFLIWGALALLLIVLAVASRFMPLSANVLTLEPSDFSVGFTEEGEIMAVSEWPVFSPIEGRIEAIRVENGDMVRNGQILFELSTSELNFALTALRAQIRSLEGQRLQSSTSPDAALAAQQILRIEQAERDVQTEEVNLARVKALYEAGAAPLAQYEEARDALDRAGNFLEQQRYGLELLYERNPGTDIYYDNQINAVQAQIGQLEDKLGKASVLASQDGQIKDLSLKEGGAVLMGQQIMTVFAGDGYKIESYVLAGDVPDIRIGGKVEAVQSAASGNRYFSGQVEAVEVAAVERISPLGLKENRVKVTIRLAGDLPAVVLGSMADVRFTTFEAKNKLLLPKTALFPYQEGEAVWVVRGGKAFIQGVIRGMENDSQVLIEGGLTAGDLVIRDPNIAGLKEGKRIAETV